MTRKEMITACVEEQIRTGFIREDNKERQIKWRLKGYGGIKAMSKAQCEAWYKEVFNA